MEVFKRRTPLKREYDKVLEKEKKYLLKNQEEKKNFITKLAEDKIPEKLRETLEKAFCQAFKLIFKNGSGLIRMSCKEKKLSQKYEINNSVSEINKDRKSFKAFNKASRSSDKVNIAVSSVSGIGMGFLGVGIPDIPVLSALMLRDIYQTAATFGFNCESEEERYFVLNIIEGAVSFGNDLCSVDTSLNLFIKEPVLPCGYDENLQIKKCAKALSNALLYMKFLQGIPVVGTIGGIYDAVFMKKICTYSTLKYKRRYLYSRLKKEEAKKKKRLFGTRG